MQPARPVLLDEKVTPASFAACYDLLEQAFEEDELDSREQMRADLLSLSGESQPVQMVMLSRLASGEQAGVSQKLPISLISGCYLKLEDPLATASTEGAAASTEGAAASTAGAAASTPPGGIGFIEYLVTRPGFQHQGHATHMLERFEDEILRISQARGDRLCLILGEVEEFFLPFKRRHGYLWPESCRYCQPPIAYHPTTGEPLYPELPKYLVVKSFVGPVDQRLLLEAVKTIFARRYAPRGCSEHAAQQAQSYIHERVYEPFARSLVVRDGNVVMR